MPSIGGSQGGSPSGDSNGGNVGPGLTGTITNSGMISYAGDLGVADMGLIGQGEPSPMGEGTPSFYSGWEQASLADPVVARGMGYSPFTGATYGMMGGSVLGPVGMGLGGIVGAASSLAQGGPVPSGGGGPGGLGGPGPLYAPQTPASRPAAPVTQPFQINPFQVQNDIMGGWGGGYQQPQMNPFSMYGGQSYNQGYNPFSMYGGK